MDINELVAQMQGRMQQSAPRMPQQQAGMWPQNIRDQYNQAFSRIQGAQSKADIEALQATYGQNTNNSTFAQSLDSHTNAAQMREQVMGQVQGSMPEWFDVNKGTVNFEMLFDQIIPGWRERFPQLMNFINRTNGTSDTNVPSSVPPQPKPPTGGGTTNPQPTSTPSPVYSNSEPFLNPIPYQPIPKSFYPIPNPHFDTNEYTFNPQKIENDVNTLYNV